MLPLQSLPSGFRVQAQATRMFYDWLFEGKQNSQERTCMQCSFRTFGKYLIAVPFHASLILATPFVMIWDMLCAVGYLLNLALGRCTNVPIKASLQESGLHILSLTFGTVGYTLGNICGLFMPNVVDCLNYEIAKERACFSSMTPRPANVAYRGV